MRSESRTLSIHIATPLGHEGRGGIDRMMDVVIAEIGDRGELGVEVTRLTTRGSRSLVLSPLFLVFAMGRLAFAHLRGGVDVLHVNLSNHGSTYRKIALAAWARVLGIPYVLHLHGGRYAHFLDTSSPTLVARIRRMFAESASVIVLGDYWARLMAARFPEIGNKLVVLPNAGRAAERIPGSGSPLRVVFLGKLVAAKGVGELISALGKLRERTDWTAVVAGDGNAATWRREAVARGIGDRIEFPGWLGPDAASRLLREADIFVLPSFVENLPVSLIEAFGVGLASITTPVGAIPEVVRDGENGVLIPPGDEKALTDALTRLLDDAELRRRLGDSARRDHAERFEIGGYLRRLVSVWRQAARTARPA